MEWDWQSQGGELGGVEVRGRMMLWVFMALGRVADWCKPWVWSFGLTLHALRFTLNVLGFTLHTSIVRLGASG